MPLLRLLRWTKLTSQPHLCSVSCAQPFSTQTKSFSATPESDKDSATKFHSYKTANVKEEFAIEVLDDDVPIKVDARRPFAYFMKKSTAELTAKMGVGNRPGKRKFPPIALPQDLLSARKILLEDHHISTEFHEEAMKLRRQIRERIPPLDFRVQEEKRKEFLRDIIGQEPVHIEEDCVTDEEKNELLQHRKNLMERKIRTLINNYKPLDFSTNRRCLLYMLARQAPDYAALVKTFNQIKTLLPDFKPASLLDFGSGVGTGTWAVDTTWPKSCKEVMNIDTSAAMHQINECLQRGGASDERPLGRRPNTTSFRHFLPLTGSLKYDLVVCSRTLFELDSRDMRFRTLDILWKTVMPGGCLVLIEGGRASSCSLILEAREFLLNGLRVNADAGRTRGMVIAPCPHQNTCPLLAKQPKYRKCSDSQLFHEAGETNELGDNFSYMVMYKAKNSEDVVENSWPRIVQPVIRTNPIRVRVCNKYGNLQELYADRAKHGTLCRQVAKRSTLGDIYPVEVLHPSSHISPDYNSFDLSRRKLLKNKKLFDEEM